MFLDRDTFLLGLSFFWRRETVLKIGLFRSLAGRPFRRAPLSSGLPEPVPLSDCQLAPLPHVLLGGGSLGRGLLLDAQVGLDPLVLALPLPHLLLGGGSLRRGLLLDLQVGIDLCVLALTLFHLLLGGESRPSPGPAVAFTLPMPHKLFLLFEGQTTDNSRSKDEITAAHTAGFGLIGSTVSTSISIAAVLVTGEVIGSLKAMTTGLLGNGMNLVTDIVPRSKVTPRNPM